MCFREMKSIILGHTKCPDEGGITFGVGFAEPKVWSWTAKTHTFSVQCNRQGHGNRFCILLT